MEKLGSPCLLSYYPWPLNTFFAISFKALTPLSEQHVTIECLSGIFFGIREIETPEFRLTVYNYFISAN